MLGKIESRRRRGQQKMRWIHGMTNSMDVNLTVVQEMLKDREACRTAVHEVTELDTTERLNKNNHNNHTFFRSFILIFQV